MMNTFNLRVLTAKQLYSTKLLHSACLIVLSTKLLYSMKLVYSTNLIKLTTRPLHSAKFDLVSNWYYVTISSTFYYLRWSLYCIAPIWQFWLSNRYTNGWNGVCQAGSILSMQTNSTAWNSSIYREPWVSSVMPGLHMEMDAPLQAATDYVSFALSV